MSTSHTRQAAAAANGAGPPGPVVTVEAITPEMAAEYLGLNRHNRRYIRSALIQYTAAMRRGEWKLNGEAIKFAPDGSLWDGQHRLQAVIASRTTQRMFVVRGVDDGSQMTLDTGRTRRFADVLSLAGEKHVDALAAACRMLHFYRVSGDVSSGGSQGWSVPTTTQLTALLEVNPGLREAAAAGWAVRRALSLGSPGVWGFAHYVCGEVNLEDTEAFFFQVKSGLDLAEGDPALVLRNAVIGFRASSRKDAHGVLSARVLAAWAIKSFNNYRQGEKMTVMRWAPGGSRPERFPQPLTDAELGLA